MSVAAKHDVDYELSRLQSLLDRVPLVLTDRDLRMYRARLLNCFILRICIYKIVSLRITILKTSDIVLIIEHSSALCDGVFRRGVAQQL